jgi:hypothetical protein
MEVLMSVPSPIYTTIDSVKVRLAGKVQFESPDGLQDGELPNALLLQLILDAETEVEQDLRSRYKIPFQSKRTHEWTGLPDHSKRAIRQIVDSKAIMNVMDTDFGRGGHIDASKYLEGAEKKYTSMVTKLLGRDQEGENDKIDRFRRSPPLDDVALAPSNAAADDGYRGMIINTDQMGISAEGFAEQQINDPSQGWLGRRGLVR